MLGFAFSLTAAALRAIGAAVAGSFPPSLDFSDARNSQYFILIF